MVQTEFSEVRFKGDTDRASNVYKGFDPLQPEDIADIIHFVVPDLITLILPIWWL
jgi:NADP-dependent 3-hydroxy acid dehydrogenase YdfG